MLEEARWQAPSALSTEQVGYFRLILASHSDQASGTCPICGVLRCQDWRTAYDQLATAGELMADPATWQGNNRSLSENQR